MVKEKEEAAPECQRICPGAAGMMETVKKPDELPRKRGAGKTVR